MGWQGIRIGIATVTFAALLSSGAVACEAPGGAAGLRDGVIGWVNEARRSRGLPALRKSAALQASATAHACDMATRGYFAHQGPGGPSLSRRLKKAGYRFRAANENIARTQAASVSAPTVFWRDSALHWANVLDPSVRDVGIGIAQAGGRVYWVMNAGKD